MNNGTTKTNKQLANGTLQQQPIGVAQPANGNHQQPNGGLAQQKQYTVIGTNEQTLLTDKQLLTGNSPLFNGASGKQHCEIHHSAFQQHHHQVANHSGGGGGAGNHSGSKKSVNFCRAWLNKFPSRSKRIDVISRIFFPKMFALFNLVYWTTYLFREDDIVRS